MADVNYGTTTDDQILDDAFEGADEGTDDSPEPEVSDNGEGADGEESEGQGQDEQDGDKGEEADKEGDEPEGAEDKEGDEKDEEKDEQEELEAQAVVPDKLKPFFKMKDGNLVKDLFYSEQAFRQIFPNVKEARELRDAFPTTADAHEAIEARDTIQQYDDLYYSEDPASQEKFIGNLHEQDPASFARMAQVWPEAHFKLDPDGYKRDTSERVQLTLQNMLAGANQDPTDPKNQNRINALNVVSMMLFGKPLDKLGAGPGRQQMSPKEAELARREQQLNDRDRKASQESFQSFYNSTNDHVVTTLIDGNIKPMVLAALKGTEWEKNPKATNKIIGDAYNKIDAIVKADRGLTSNLKREFRSKAYDQKQRDTVTNLILGRAKAVLKTSVTRAINDWNELVKGSSKQRIDARKGKTGRVDITGGGGKGAGQAQRQAPRKVTADQIDYSKTRDEDILDDQVVLRPAKRR